MARAYSQETREWGRGQLGLVERPDAVDSGQRPEPERGYVPSHGFVDNHTDVSMYLMQGGSRPSL